VTDEADFLAAGNGQGEVPVEDRLLPVGEPEPRELDLCGRDHERRGPGPVRDFVRLQKLLQAFADLAVVAHRLGEVLAEEKHALLQGHRP
jgi:hypothetical protein